MNRHERLNPRQRDKGISFGFMAAIIPIAAAFLLEEVLFRAPKGVSLEAHHLAGPRSRFTDKEPIPTDTKTNTVTIPSGATAEVLVDGKSYCVHDFPKKGIAYIKSDGKIRRREDSLEYRMQGGDAVVLYRKKLTHIFDDGTVVEWKP